MELGLREAKELGWLGLLEGKQTVRSCHHIGEYLVPTSRSHLEM